MDNLSLRLIALILIAVSTGAASAESLVMPVSGRVYLEVTTAKTGADWKFGMGTTPENCHVYLSSLPDTSYPKGEIAADSFNAGDTIRFCMWSKYGANTSWAFSDGTDAPSRVAFGDVANALRMGGNIIEKTSPTTRLMHLDNAVSYLFDDSNDDILVRIRIDSAVTPPQPAVSSAAAISAPSGAAAQGANAANKKGAKSWQQATVTDISDERVYVGSTIDLGNQGGNIKGTASPEYRRIWSYTIDAGNAVYVVMGDCGFGRPCRLAVNGPVQIAFPAIPLSLSQRLLVLSHQGAALIYIKDGSGKEHPMSIEKTILKP